MGGALVPTLIAALVCGAAIFTFLRVAARAGLVDDGSDAPDRKSQKAVVPLVGGPAIACAIVALVVFELVFSRETGRVGYATSASIAGFGVELFWFLAALACAFATGFVDDRAARGLGPIAKLVGQSIAAIALAHGLRDGSDAASIGAQVLCALGAIAAMNVANTFDNADGALTSVATLALAFVSPLFGATVVFLPFNSWLRQRTSDAPRAYLGDSGSHLLGLVLFATPVGRAALLVPLCDILRVVFERWRAGDPIWRGDRRHLAHRLQDAGRSRDTVVFLVCACALPAVLGTALGTHAAGIAAWSLVSVLLFVILVVAERRAR